MKTILIIDDSATIRRLVDRCLTAAGYRVVAAATAEEGLQLAETTGPDLVLLDHQLPGTTGTDVAHQLLEAPAVAQIPVVVSSTLRKKAYAEYMELANVVDMLPKPYTEELLTTTVENALSTASMVVNSQSEGTAVPEVLRGAAEPDFCGRFGSFGIREVLDFLNNSQKAGVLEVEGAGQRVFFFLSGGRISGVSASGVDVDELIRRLPDSLQNLAPVVNLTISGRGGAELDGLVELLNRKVVDPRLLRKLLRHQAAVLAWWCFNDELKEFRFTQEEHLPPLMAKLPLDISVLALLIEGALCCDASDLPPDEQDHVYLRRAIRGQNLDRAGVAAAHMKILSSLGDRHSSSELAGQIELAEEDVRRVLWAMVRAELVERTQKGLARQVVVYEPDPVAAGKLREVLAAESLRYFGKVVRDRFALQLVLRRSQPDAFLFSVADEVAMELMREQQTRIGVSSNSKWIGLVPDGVEEHAARAALAGAELDVHSLVWHPVDAEQFCTALDQVFDQDEAAPVDVQADASACSTVSWAGSA